MDEFTFTKPGEKPGDSPTDKEPDMDADDSPMSRDEMGRAAIDAINAGDGEAFFEAVRRIIDSPDAE